MSSDYGVDKVPSDQFGRLARGYAEKVMRLKRNLPYPPESAEGMTDAEYESLVIEAVKQNSVKITRLTDKLRALIKELLTRVGVPNLPLSVVGGTRTTFPRILANCPACHGTVNFVESVKFKDGKLGLKCPSCGVERWEP